MKTAEEWAKETGDPSCEGTMIYTLSEVRAIQLDAWRQGMTDAARITKQHNAGVPVGNEMTFQDVADDFVRDIEVARDSRTTI